MRRARALSIGLTVLAWACGSRSQLDWGADATAAEGDATVDVGPDVRDARDELSVIEAGPPLVTCDGGYFIEVSDDAGTTMLRHDWYNGADVPSKTCTSFGEDCWGTTAFEGNDEYGTYLLVGENGCGGSCAPFPVGAMSALGSRRDLDGSVWTGGGTLNVVGSDDAAVRGVYSMTMTLWVPSDGGAATTDDIHGAFCVHP
ncbi:MAG TPA: hypothetical protein VLM85_08745 [Polyangiaceae bacterium]|nr:hypothetical protein [Polyangiaceae bacterium]